MASLLDETFADLAVTHNPAQMWSVATRGLARVGLDQVNYAYLDFESYNRVEARGDPAMSTMRTDWIEYYADRKYDLDDEIVAHVRAGRSDPKFFILSRPDHFAARQMAEEARSAGLQAGLLTPLPGLPGDLLPAAGIVMGSSEKETEAARIIQTYGTQLVALAHLLHAGIVGEVSWTRSGMRRLSVREYDCLRMIAEGHRVGRIADRLSIAEVTVGLHLQNARKKLKARTLAEAVAKAVRHRQMLGDL